MTVTEYAKVGWASPIPSPHYLSYTIVVVTYQIKARYQQPNGCTALSLHNEVRSRPTYPPIYQPHVRLSMVWDM